jgi:diamine N-acetyltransferase
MEVSVTIRRAVLPDANDLLQLAARTYYETFAPVNTPENMDAYMNSAFNPSRLIDELNDPQATFILAEVEQGLAGYAKLLTGPAPECVRGQAPVELVRFYIEKRWQGVGVASVLMKACLDEAEERGFRTIYLGVWEKNERAKAFYRKWNFKHVGEHIFYMGADPQVDWWMMRSI